MKEKIKLILQQFGPLLPVEVASKTGLDSFMAKAYLSELIEAGAVKMSREKIADSNLYFLPGQDSQVQMRLAQLSQQSQKTARLYSASDVNVSPEVQAKREAFARRLAEIEHEEQRRKSAQKQTPIQRIPSQPISKPPSLSSPPVPLRPSKSSDLEQPEFKPPEPQDSYVDKAMDWLRSENIEIIEELNMKKTEVELLVKVYTEFGHTNFYVKIRQKKTITEPDLIAVYASAMEQKCPGVLITDGQLAKSAQNFLDEKGGTVKVKQISF